MNDTTQRLNQTLEAIKDELAELENPSNFDVLDTKFEVNLNGDVTSIELIITTGGPHITLNLITETINGVWGTDTAHLHLNERTTPEAIEGVNLLYDHYTNIWNAQNKY